MADNNQFNIKTPNLQKAKKKGIVDVVFLIDTTGSMGPVIASIADNISTFVQNIDSNTVKDYRIKVASFGDLDVDRPEISMILNRNWTNNPQEVVNQLQECINIVQEGGGGDEPESSLDALYNVIAQGIFDAPWNERTRVVVMFTDAPPKAIKKETLGIELTPDEAVEKLAGDIKENHIHLFLYAPEHPHYETLKRMAGDYVNYEPIKGDAVAGLRNLDFNKVMETLGKSVSQPSNFN